MIEVFQHVEDSHLLNTFLSVFDYLAFANSIPSRIFSALSFSQSNSLNKGPMQRPKSSTKKICLAGRKDEREISSQSPGLARNSFTCFKQKGRKRMA
jgi:hypothetical protein